MEGRGRSRRDYPSRSEEKSRSDRGNNPPSRHLWVGNISHSITERAFAHHFLQFGELESVAFQPGRSYAFVNYRNEEDAYAAMKELQGFSIGGNPLRVEFAKAEKALSSRDGHFSERWDDRRSPMSQRDSRDHRSSPEVLHLKKSKMNDKDAEPSEVLWIGFPAQLKVDEFVLRKAFSPFGEIEKITTFPGRTYAFVRFRKVMAACRAKETLQGKLFGNPRVHICFARNDSGPSNRERNLINAPPSPLAGAYERSGSFEHFRSERSFMPDDPSIRSPYNSLDPGGRNSIGRDAHLWSGGNDALEQRRYLGQGSELRPPVNIYNHPDSPRRTFDTRIREFSPQNFSRHGPIYDDPWDLPEDVSLLHGAKKLKTGTFPGENDLPEFPFSDMEKAKQILPHPDIPPSDIYDTRNSGYRSVPESLVNITTTHPLGERDDHWNASRDDFQASSVPLIHIDRRRLTPERRESSSKEVWKWEGVIAKGGNPICRARCFPVGKPPDMVLPEYLDCTARTTLDMLAKHYYQAASAWVVFFVPANDPDISYYNEFMNYLGERQRAAVAKLDEVTTLFLVPPSEFSEKVLKVPGKLSISGVVLRLDASGSSYGSVPQYGNREPPFPSNQVDLAYQKPISPSRPYLPAASLPMTIVATSHSMSNMQPGNAQGHDYGRNPTPGQNWSSHDLQVMAMQPSNPPAGSFDQHYSGMPRTSQEATHRNYTPENIPMNRNDKFMVQEKTSVPPSAPLLNLPAEQVAQLASSLLGQQGQFSGMCSTGEYTPSGNTNQSGYPYVMPPNYEMPNDQVSSDFPPPQQYSQVQQLQQPQMQSQNITPQAAPQMNLPTQNSGQDDSESDPQKRLQATLQLAAALLQQIQQGKGN